MDHKPSRNFAYNETGSISVLITSLFLLVFILSVGIIDISDSYLAKRELIQIGEDAILVASHSLDENLYYSDFQSMSAINGRVPIDCQLAEIKFHTEINQKNLRENKVVVSGWRCSGDEITASITSKIQALVNFPILSNLNGGNIDISAIIGATSELSNNA
jgi:uncharacterized membrane protein